jgi:hypothetical protein
MRMQERKVNESYREGRIVFWVCSENLPSNGSPNLSKREAPNSPEGERAARSPRFESVN